MKWLLKDPTFGDMLRVKTGDIYHYGIFASDDEVIQFGPTPNAQQVLRNDEIKVIATDIDAFLAGGFLEVAEFDKKEKKKNRTPQNTVEYARASLGRGGYNILYNNCEHFANECISGCASSAQTDSIRNLFRKMPVVDVFTATLPKDCQIKTVFPAERNTEIQVATCERVKREKYCAWQLLKYALERSLGIKLENLRLTKDPNGKWTAPDCYFSISHSGDLLAVAVSRAPVGIDVEAANTPMQQKLAEKILNEKEKAEYLLLPEEQRSEFLRSAWVAKEATFKRQGLQAFIPCEIYTNQDELASKTITLENSTYLCSIATSTPKKIRFFEDIPQKKYLI